MSAFDPLQTLRLPVCSSVEIVSESIRMTFNAFVAAVVALGQAVVLPPPSSEPPTDVGGAKPINARAWFTGDDFPASAVAAGHQGVVYVSVAIGTDGRVSDCHVVQSSGYAELDTIPCPLLMRRARFKPALDEQRQPKATVGIIPVPFRMSQ